MDQKEIKKKIIGARIKVIRNELGLTMNEFGKKFDPPASDSIVSRWERGISSPNNERLKRIAELGNISMLYLTTGKKSFSDLNDNEKKYALTDLHSKVLDTKSNLQETVKDYLKELLQAELSFAESIHLLHEFQYFSNSNDEDLLFMASLLKVLNDSREISEDFSQEQKLGYIENLSKDLETFLKKRFSYKEGE